MSRSWGWLVVAAWAVAGGSPAGAQEKTLSERAREYWDKVLTKLESGATSAADEYHKLKAEAATASGPARAKLAEEMEAVGKTWAAAREALATSLERHAHNVHEDLKSIEAKMATATGPARDKLAAEAEALQKHWAKAREKVAAAFSANMKAASTEYAHLKDEAGRASDDARAKIGPRMDRLKAEWSTNRDKLAAYLKEDLRRTEEDLRNLGDATTEAAKAAKEKLTKKYRDLRGQSESLAAEKAPDEAP